LRDEILVSHAIAAALPDKNALVQRGVLDLLLGELPCITRFSCTLLTSLKASCYAMARLIRYNRL